MKISKIYKIIRLTQLAEKANTKIKMVTNAPLGLYWSSVELVRRKQQLLNFHQVVADILPLLDDEDHCWLIGHPYEADKLCHQVIKKLINSCSSEERGILDLSLEEVEA